MHKMAPQGPGAKTFIQLNHTFAEYSLSTSHAPSLSPSFLFSFIKIPGQVNFKKDKFQKVAMKDHLPTRTPSNPLYWVNTLNSSWRTISPSSPAACRLSMHLQSSYRGHTESMRRNAAVPRSKDKSCKGSQQGNKDLSPTTARNWIWPTTWMSLGVDSCPRAPHKEHRPANTQFQPCETLRRGSSWAHLDSDPKKQ